MKIKIYILLALVAGFASCGKEKPESDPEETGEKVVILLSTSARSGSEEIREGDVEDRKVTSLRLLAYHHKTSTLYKNYKLALPDVKDPQTIEILTGRYDFVLIANEGSDTETAMATKLENLLPGSPISTLDELYFPRSAFSSELPIPMVTVCREIVIVGDRKYIDTNHSNEVKEGAWSVELERLGVRVDADITFKDDLSPDDWKLILVNVPDRAYLLPAEGDEAQNRAVVRSNEPILYGAGTGAGQTRSWSRIIVPENVFDPATNVANATRIGVINTVGDEKYSAPIGYKLDTKDYTLPRNLWVGVDAVVADKIILGPITVAAWDQPQNGEIPL